MLSRKFNTKLLAQMPLLQKIREGGDEGKPIVLKDPASESANLFRELARKVAQEVAIRSQSAAGAQGLQIEANWSR